MRTSGGARAFLYRGTLLLAFDYLMSAELGYIALIVLVFLLLMHVVLSLK